MFDGIVRSLFSYGEVITYPALKFVYVQKSINSIQRPCCVNIARLYQRCPLPAAQILANFESIDLAVMRTAIIRSADIGTPSPEGHNLAALFPKVTQVAIMPVKNQSRYLVQDLWLSRGVLKQTLLRSSHDAWQDRWEKAEHGRDTFKWFQSVQIRINSEYIPDFYSAQFISEYGFFSSKLHLWGLIPSPNCICGRLQSGLHLLQDCQFPLVTQLRELFPVTPFDLSRPNISNLQLLGRELFVLREALRGPPSPPSEVSSETSPTNSLVLPLSPLQQSLNNPENHGSSDLDSLDGDDVFLDSPQSPRGVADLSSTPCTTASGTQPLTSEPLSQLGPSPAQGVDHPNLSFSSRVLRPVFSKIKGVRLFLFLLPN